MTASDERESTKPALSVQKCRCVDSSVLPVVTHIFRDCGPASQSLVRCPQRATANGNMHRSRGFIDFRADQRRPPGSARNDVFSRQSESPDKHDVPSNLSEAVQVSVLKSLHAIIASFHDSKRVLTVGVLDDHFDSARENENRAVIGRFPAIFDLL